MRIALYARVSKAVEQNPQNQITPLLNWIKNTDHTQYKDSTNEQGIFIDQISSKDTRPKKEELLKLLRLGVIDGVAFVALDRWGRTMSELVLELEEFSRTGKALISLKEGLDLSSAAGRLMGNILASMANFERDIIKERTIAGLARATAQGKIKGRHPINCGCGKLMLDGTRHNGDIKPVRDKSNVFIGWNYPSGEFIPLRRKQTPSNLPISLIEKK